MQCEASWELLPSSAWSQVLVMDYLDIRVSRSAFSLTLPIMEMQPVGRNLPLKWAGMDLGKDSG